MATRKTFPPDMVANNLTPAYPTHPGSVLKDEIEYRGISQRQLAREMGISVSVLNEILNARRPLNERTALLIEAVLGVDAGPLLAMQTDYNMQTIRKDRSFLKRLSQIKRVAAVL